MKKTDDNNNPKGDFGLKEGNLKNTLRHSSNKALPKPFSPMAAPKDSDAIKVIIGGK
jgi:hypothetical protein